MIKFIPDLIALAGLGCLGYGLWLYEPWVAFTAVGGLVVAFGVLLGARAEK